MGIIRIFAVNNYIMKAIKIKLTEVPLFLKAAIHLHVIVTELRASRTKTHAFFFIKTNSFDDVFRLGRWHHEYVIDKVCEDSPPH